MPQRSFTKITGENIRQIKSLHRRAENLILKNNFRNAVKVYSDIILLEPDDDLAYSRMGQSYMILGDFGRAENAFLNALDINPENEEALQGLQKMRDPDSTPNG